MLGPTLPTLAEKTASSLALIAWLFTAKSLGYLFGALGGGAAYDRLPGHRLQAVALLGFTVCLVLAPLMHSLPLLLLVMLLLGLMEGVVDNGGNLLLVWTHGERANPYLNGLHFAFGIGALLSPIIVAQALQRTGGVDWAFWLMALLPLPVALLLLRLPSPAAPPPHTHRQAPSAAAGALLVALIAVLFFLYVGAEGAFGGWIYTYATLLDLGSQASAAYLTSAFWGALTAARLVSVWLAARLRPETLLAGDLLFSLLFLVLILAFPYNYLLVWVGAIGLGASMASFFPSMLIFAGQRLPNTGSITRWFFVASGVGGMALPWLVGQLVERQGALAIIQVITVCVALSLGIFLLALSYARRIHPVE